ncbi:MAG: hypothetical protein F6J97_22045 [Leptolyngbya sp. SIO4C1]|nr:hypothetical protein [Leptolyngbya sp. SIO4C1]
MLDRLVRPLVRTQIQLLAQTQSASTRLISMISQWLGYLGVQAQVTHLKAQDGKVQIALAVGRPQQCSEQEWQQILHNIEQHSNTAEPAELTYAAMSRAQQIKVHRLLAHVIQAGNPDTALNDSDLRQRLQAMGMDAVMVSEINTAMKVPTLLEPLLSDLEPEVAAFVLSRAIGIALIDREISQDEDSALKAIYGVLETRAKG